ncbi:hypothetical protein BDC45DRAFT_540947 [Circinella umbellata]|nr:hypothetical protein BDC45DRAFT_540947 [Circinella umbellata]
MILHRSMNLHHELTLFIKFMSLVIMQSHGNPFISTTHFGRGDKSKILVRSHRLITFHLLYQSTISTISRDTSINGIFINSLNTRIYYFATEKLLHRKNYRVVGSQLPVSLRALVSYKNRGNIRGQIIFHFASAVILRLRLIIFNFALFIVLIYKDFREVENNQAQTALFTFLFFHIAKLIKSPSNIPLSLYIKLIT